MSAFTGPMEYFSVQFHDPAIPLPDYDDANGYFGVVKFQVRSDVAIPSGVYLVHMEKDGSGSMSILTSDGRSRDEHVKATICNAIRALTKIAMANPQIHIYVQVSDFDTAVYPVLQLSQISPDNVEQLVAAVQDRKLPEGNTNLENALSDSVKSCDAFLALHPDAHVLSVVTTDGEVNNGECNKYRLQEIVKDRPYPTVCIGYGAEHNADLLITVGSSYFYVSDFERAGEPIGEMLQNLLYIAIANTHLHIANGEIWHEKQWMDTLPLGNAIGGSSKTFSVRSKTPLEVRVQLSDIMETSTPTFSDLTRDMFRHKTVILLAEARDNLAEDIVGPIHPQFSATYAADMERYEVEMLAYEQRIQSNLDEKKTLRDKLKVFFRLMKDYAKSNHMENEALMKQLLDDVYTVWLALGNRFTQNEARAFTQAKYICNERQLSNNTSARIATQTTPLRRQNARYDSQECDSPCKLQRTCMTHPGMDEEEDDDELDHELTDGVVSAYATQSTIAMMNEISSLN